jgi:nitrile hydratase accessory protein
MSALPSLPGMPADDDGPVFAEPWQARAFALTVAMHQRGLFDWTEWAGALAAAIAANPDEPYYHQWLVALEGMVAAKRIADPEALTRTQQAWQRAAERTPHGQAILLTETDYRAMGGG